MSKPRLFGLVVLGTGCPVGLIFAAVCLVVGLVLLVAYEAMESKLKCNEPKTVTSAGPTTPVLVLVKEVHARPQRDGKFQEVSAPNQSNLLFEVFANCWLVSQASLPVAITELQLV
jgi:hypothetical protein